VNVRVNMRLVCLALQKAAIAGGGALLRRRL